MFQLKILTHYIRHTVHKVYEKMTIIQYFIFDVSDFLWKANCILQIKATQKKILVENVFKRLRYFLHVNAFHRGIVYQSDFFMQPKVGSTIDRNS